MAEIAKYSCQDVTEARIREQEHYDLLNLSLNILNPISSNEYSVLAIDDRISIEKINNTSEYKFYCNFCDYGTSKKSSFDDYLLSARHKKAV